MTVVVLTALFVPLTCALCALSDRVAKWWRSRKVYR